jgi:uncharacterized protein (TIGR02186 family)
MMRAPLALLAALIAPLALAISAPPAAAERIIASLSNHRVQVSSSFAGEDLVLFGIIERDPGDPARRGPYDIVATVTGPRQNLVTFRKARVLGIWVNTDSRVFDMAPAYLAVLSTRPLDQIANAETLRRLQLGLANTVLNQRAAVTIADSAPDDPFRLAFLKLRQQQQLYREATNGITFPAASLYRASIPLPAESPVGTYDVDVRLFADGSPVARQTAPFEVYKSGFERQVTAAARDHGFLYGLATALMAVLTGWLASVIFRRD